MTSSLTLMLLLLLRGHSGDGCDVFVVQQTLLKIVFF